MATRWIGNDVVDLDHPRTQGKEWDERFLDRVFTYDERALIVRSGEAPVLWLLWAAKEAAYKIVCKAGGPRPPFRHRAFRVEPASGPERSGELDLLRGSVYHEARVYPFEARRSGEWIHVVALQESASDSGMHEVVKGVSSLPALRSGWEETLRARFSDREWEGVRTFASAAVRLRCRPALAEALGVPEHGLEIVHGPGPAGRAPPALLLRGKPVEVDLSLSHHGRFIAWSFLPPRAPLSRQVGS